MSKKKDIKSQEDIDQNWRAHEDDYDNSEEAYEDEYDASEEDAYEDEYDDSEEDEYEDEYDDSEEEEYEEDYDDSEEDDEFSDEEESYEEELENYKKRKKRRKIIGITVGSILGVLLAVYFGAAFYFQEHYYFFTEINGKDFSGKTVADVEKYMESQVSGYTLTLKELDGGQEQILGSEIGLKYQPGTELKKYLEKQNPFLWPQAFWKKDKVQTSIGVKYDENALNEKITSLTIMQPENQTPPVSAVPVFNGTEYVIQPETYGTQVNDEVFRTKVAEAIHQFQPMLEMESEGCYAKPQFTSQSQEVVAAKDTMNSYLNAAITYDLNPNTEVVDRTLISQWLAADANMAVAVNREQVAAYVADLAARYNTVGTTRTIQTPAGKTAQVSGGSYGWEINQEAEIEALIGNITRSEQVTREPEYSQRAVIHAANDWGNTFIEVDLSAQHMWYIVDGASAFEADVVTGKPDPKHATPAGIFSILEKMRNKVLKGEIQENGKPEYETPVSYWMRVTWTGIGFHDATWQSSFGGTRYKDGYGSHGCINMTYNGAATLYDMIYVGVPVIMHY
ncbi:L,D-transpeptidase/peptidoglycan binding protein [Faecalicatena sp. Marseille-Q4148]|nr:L,D-transpeptidase/peptidoglycan binding protein [Faecalicatena sp. Marseille-Q4148]